jgi:hypothetical protein
LAYSAQAPPAGLVAKLEDTFTRVGARVKENLLRVGMRWKNPTSFPFKKQVPPFLPLRPAKPSLQPNRVPRVSPNSATSENSCAIWQ